MKIKDLLEISPNHEVITIRSSVFSAAVITTDNGISFARYLQEKGYDHLLNLEVVCLKSTNDGDINAFVDQPLFYQ